jgi:hypothetical protein
MHCRSRYLWALGAFFAFVALLVFDGRPNVVLDGAGAIYVPPAPNRLVKAVPVVPRLQSHFDRCTHALRSTNLSLALRAVRTSEGSQRVAGAAQALYGPFHRRPPPSLS